MPQLHKTEFAIFLSTVSMTDTYDVCTYVHTYIHHENKSPFRANVVVNTNATCGLQKPCNLGRKGCVFDF